MTIVPASGASPAECRPPAESRAPDPIAPAVGERAGENRQHRAARPSVGTEWRERAGKATHDGAERGSNRRCGP